MATPKHQRIGIWIIAVVTIIGTIGSFAVIVLANRNDQIDQQQQQKLYADYQKQMEEQKQKTLASLRPLDGYTAEPFDASSVTDLKVETLVQGDGKEATADSTVTANYFGWTSDGKMFDSSNKNGTTTPIDFKLSQVIAGWAKGLTGVKVGSTVRLTIPEAQAYGATAAQNGQPAGPLMFIVELKGVK
jgi:FKBP-type peptidyl-prolyl cis-trans isomerase